MVLNNKLLYKNMRCVSAMSSPTAWSCLAVGWGWHEQGPRPTRNLVICCGPVWYKAEGCLRAAEWDAQISLQWDAVGMALEKTTILSFHSWRFSMGWVAKKLPLFSPFLAGSLCVTALCKRFHLPRLAAELSSVILHPRCRPPSLCSPARLGFQQEGWD